VTRSRLHHSSGGKDPETTAPSSREIRQTEFFGGTPAEEQSRLRTTGDWRSIRLLRQAVHDPLHWSERDTAAARRKRRPAPRGRENMIGVETRGRDNATVMRTKPANCSKLFSARTSLSLHLVVRAVDAVSTDSLFSNHVNRQRAGRNRSGNRTPIDAGHPDGDELPAVPVQFPGGDLVVRYHRPATSIHDGCKA
jgi:hypothetical protein